MEELELKQQKKKTEEKQWRERRETEDKTVYIQGEQKKKHKRNK